MADNMFQGEIDPEIAALLGKNVPAEETAVAEAVPGEKRAPDDAGEEEAEVQGPNLISAGFPEITKRFEAKPHQFFSDPAYYKVALSEEGDIAKRVHGLLQKYLAAKDPKDRSVFRQQFIKPYWDFLAEISKKTIGRLPPPKKFLLRFAILHPTLINAETRAFFSKIVVDNSFPDQPVYYLDEWLKAIGTSVIRPSTTDEVNVARNNQAVKIQALLEKANGKLDGARSLLKIKDNERQNLEKMLQERVQVILEHVPLDGFEDINACYNEGQKKTFIEIQEVMKGLLKADREMDTHLRNYHQSVEDVESLKGKAEEGGAAAVDFESLDTEFNTVRQMAKMTIGRQGNHFPVLTSDYFHCGPNDVGIRENVLAMLAHIESIDAEAYYRVYRNNQNRIVPYTLLIPTYGDTGFCWEPFDKHNRATSRGRIVVPMYPKNLYVAVLSAVADLRWQVAKEKASYYWMEEGLTGNYYQWFQAQKLKGDIKEFFVQDYILWMTKEAEGIQKLDKEVRGTFWRFMPFTQQIKEKLKTRSLVYQELCQRDLNRAMSDGY